MMLKLVTSSSVPVVLLDHYDNCASGGTMDTTDTLREILRQGLEDVVFFGIYDPAAVEAAIEAGVGATVPPSRLAGTASWMRLGMARFRFAMMFRNCSRV